ncbi:hypothetical protein B6A42_22730 [Vibrio coralliilyticus]|jgi:hypothetical protein|uniref:hypothetical protein n=1 Tax=Vibrio coralliilyticus TaxID=190893 RepID=UPI0009C1BCE8|nr:hypothetical protein B6A42_22730 [Vibrio coralliilyticus]
MYNQLCDLLDEIGYTFDQHELKACALRAQKNNIMKSLLATAKDMSFDLRTDREKSIISSIASVPNIDQVEAVNQLKVYISSDDDQRNAMRDELLWGVVRNSEEFNILLVLNGEAVERCNPNKKYARA